MPKFESVRALVRSRYVRLTLAVALVAAIYWAADWSAVLRALAGLDGVYLAAAFVLFLPQTVVSATRWRGLAARWARLSLAGALRHTLLASAANLVVPSKLGDFSKGAMLPVDPQRPTGAAAALVALEKVSDLAAVAAIALVGWCGFSWHSLLVAAAIVCALGWLRSGAGTALTLVGTTVALWCLHVWQIDLFLRAAGVEVTADVAAARIPLALLAGVVPLTLWGVGTRDAALVALFADVASPATMAAVGLLTASRYLVPGACGALLLAARSASRPAESDAEPRDSSVAICSSVAASSR